MSLSTYVTATNCDRFSLSLNSSAFVPVAPVAPPMKAPVAVKASMGLPVRQSLGPPEVKVSSTTAVKSTAISSMNVAG